MKTKVFTILLFVSLITIANTINAQLCTEMTSSSFNFIEDNNVDAFMNYDGNDLRITNNQGFGNLIFDIDYNTYFQSFFGNIMTLRDGGNVGIGTTTPGYRLSLGSSLADTKLALYQSSTNSADNYGMGVQAGQFKFNIGNPQARYAFLNQPSGTEIFTIKGSGSVGLGDTTPDYLLEVNGSAGKPGGGSWSNSSDRRLKNDISDFEDGLKEIMEIRPVWYRYNGMYNLPTEEKYVGVIAQEIQKVAPYTVTPYMEENEDGTEEEYLSYNGTAVTYMLVNAVQELHTEKEELQEEVHQLEEQVTKLTTLVEELLKKEDKGKLS